jgi:threonine aldolase
MAKSTAKYSFGDDYSEGMHPTLLEALIAANSSQQIAYGNDVYTQKASDAIRTQLGCPDTVGVWFVPSGTSANAISIGSCLRPHESVISASSGHIVVRETGAVEATGHKIINVPPVNGKLTVDSITQALQEVGTIQQMHCSPRLISTRIGTSLIWPSPASCTFPMPQRSELSTPKPSYMPSSDFVTNEV